MKNEFSKRVELESTFHYLVVWVRPDTDLESSFDAICDDTGETLRINGWLFEEVEAAPDFMPAA